MRAVRSLFALTALIATFASAAHAGALADLEVYDRTSGRTLPIYEHEGGFMSQASRAISTSCASAIHPPGGCSP